MEQCGIDSPTGNLCLRAFACVCQRHSCDIARIVVNHAESYRHTFATQQHGVVAILQPSVDNRFIRLSDAELLGRYRREFSEYAALRSKIKRIKEQIAKNKENREFIVFQLEQLDKCSSPVRVSLRQVEQEFDMLSDSDRSARISATPIIASRVATGV